MSNDELNMVRRSFESSAQDKAPEGLWGAIDEELHQQNIDQQVKDSFEGAEPSDFAPEFVWEKVQDQLDIDRMWNNIAGRIIMRQRIHLLRYASILFLVFLPFYLQQGLKSDYLNARGPVLISEQSTLTSHTTPLNTSIGKDSPIVSTARVQLAPNPASTISVAPIADQNRDVQSTKGTLVAAYSNDIKKNKESLAVENDTNLGLSPMHQRYTVEPNLKLLPTKKYTNRTKRLMLGVVSGVDNTWILDNTTRAGFENSSLVQNNISFGGYYGIFGEWKLKRRFAITGEYIFQARSRQNLGLFNTKGEYVHQYKEINTQRVALLSTFYTQPKFLGVSHSNVFKFGVCYANVKSNFTSVDGAITSQNSIQNRHDFGLQVEIGKRVYLGSFVVGAGVRGHLGLLNMAPPNGDIPASLNFTRVASAGAHLRVGYIF